ncbi:LuxR family transcriptional regulator [Erythrobacter sp. SCSIO 43205]|uniref:helix-turn-helix transcriptional regulator n=1 Tax=Erythrobacter sp. SCSIO 43205 TaxID=2779361 RepID=UPI001CA85355|nr:LuxR family transcriptional regulator [Erythrobacter sp. SCSIO 43205]
MTARSEVPDHHAEVLERCHEHIISLGKPVVLSQMLPLFAQAEPQLTREIMSEANRMGVYDQYMIPVFGPFDMNGLIAFGFAEAIPEDSREMRRDLEAAAASHHNQMVRHFVSNETPIELSGRESDVLTWIARGKSKSEISTILSISVSSVDTYTRRIFEKMGVNSRVAAAIAGVTQGLVKP